MMSAESVVRGCLGKVQYPTKEKAETMADECTRKRGKPIRVYQCPGCTFWHLTKRPLLKDQTPLCGECLQPFEPESEDEWRCDECKHGIENRKAS